MDSQIPKNSENESKLPMENDDLMIMPEGELQNNENQAEQPAIIDLSGQQAVSPQEPTSTVPTAQPPAPAPAAPIAPAPAVNEPHVTVKARENKKKDTFDMKLAVMNKKVEQIKEGKKAEALQASEEKAKKIIKKEEKKIDKMQQEPRTIAGVLFKAVFVLVLAVLAFGTTIFLDDYFKNKDLAVFDNRFIAYIPQGESISVDGQSVEELYEFEGGEVLNTGDVKGVTINLPIKGLIRVDKDTTLALIKHDSTNGLYIFELQNGKIWGNLLNNFFDLRINSGEISILPSVSSFEVEYDGSRTKIYSHKHDVQVEILADNKIRNKMWIAEGNQGQFLDTKIVQEADTIEQLLYSKLVKEFNYGVRSQSNISDNSWVVGNILGDEEFKKSITSIFINIVRDEGLKSLSTESLRFKTKELIADLRKALTFSDDKKISALVADIFENIDDAAFLFLKAKNQDAKVRLSLFEDDVRNPDIVQNEFPDTVLYSNLEDYLRNYIFASPGETFYPIRVVLLDEVLSSSQLKNLEPADQYNLLTIKLNDVYDALERNSADSAQLITAYIEKYNELTSRYRKNLTQIKDEIIKQNILFDNLLLKNPSLYTLKIFEGKKQIEDDYLEALTSTRDKKEQRQTYINEKINLLLKIKTFLFDEELNPVDARQVVFRLITDIEVLQKDTIGLAAINALFEQRLEDFGIFWEYLKSDEYSTSRVHGETHLESFEAFKAVQVEILTFEDIRDEILGTQQKEKELSVSDILHEAEADLNAAEMTKVTFGSYKDPSKKTIPIISATISGVSFRANYDWDRQLLSDIVVGQDVISEDGVKLSKAKIQILEYLAAQTESEEVEEEIEEEEETEYDNIFKVAKVFLVNKFIGEGISIGPDYIRVIDLDNGLYDITDVYYAIRKEVTFSFEYNSKTEKVSNIRIKTKKAERVLTESINLTILDQIVFSIYDQDLN